MSTLGPGSCDHLWDDSTTPGWPYVCLVCGVLARDQRWPGDVITEWWPDDYVAADG